MRETIEFAKLSGSGNDFICLDGRDGRYEKLLSGNRAGAFARRLCHRGLGIGADGVIFALTPEIEEVSDIGAKFFEPDGSEAELCGNGTACFLHWVTSNGWVPDRKVKILTPAGVVLGSNGQDGFVRVCIPDPEQLERDIQLEAGGRRWRCDFAITGVPHVIAYVEDIDAVEVCHFGPFLRHHERFAPRGANANFVQVLGDGHVALRTFEFGVEDETLACGTGSATAAILAAVRFDWIEKGFGSEDKPVLVRARSGDELKVWFTLSDDGRATDVCLETIVRRIFSGTVDPELADPALAET